MSRFVSAVVACFLLIIPVAGWTENKPHSVIDFKAKIPESVLQEMNEIDRFIDQAMKETKPSQPKQEKPDQEEKKDASQTD